MGKLPLLPSLAVVLLLVVGNAYGQANVDLNNWNHEGNQSTGNWNIEGGGSSVKQTLNDAPTYFVSDVNFYDTTIQGRFGVETFSDDDFIGFVFGYQKSLAENSDDPLDVDYLLLDWKQNAQSNASAGFRLSYVNGREQGNHAAGSQMWGQTSGTWSAGGDSGEVDFTSFDPVPTADFDVGWADNTAYDFTLLYEPNHIRIDIESDSGTFAGGQTIFDVSLDDIDPDDSIFGGAFPEGRFGFYNHSQAQVRYESFTEEANSVLSTGPADDGTLEFGPVRVGESGDAELTVTNAGGTGATTLTGTVEAGTGDFSGPADVNFALEEGESIDKTFTFAPTARGLAEDDILVSSDATSGDPEALITLAGLGVGPEYDSSVAAGGALDFGEVLPDDTASLLLNIGNITGDDNGGNDDLTDMTLDYAIVGVDAGLFEVDLTPDSVVSQGGNLDVLVTFLGASVADIYNATLNIFTDENAALGDTTNGSAYSYSLVATSAVPEPTTGLTLLLATLGGATLGRPRRRPVAQAT